MFIICVIHIVGLVLLPVLLLQSSLIRYCNFLQGFYVEIVPGGSEKKDATKTIYQVFFFLKFGISSNYNMLFHILEKKLLRMTCKIGHLGLPNPLVYGMFLAEFFCSFKKTLICDAFTINSMQFPCQID